MINEAPAELGVTFAKSQFHPGTTKIGDRLIFSALPEMYFKKHGKRLIDIDKCWFWDYCPYVVRDVEPRASMHLQAIADRTTHNNYLRGLPVYLSIADRYTAMFSMDCTIRHPKLYRFEDAERDPRKVILHTTGDRMQPTMLGEDAPKIMSMEMINTIKENYKNYDIVQVGDKYDLDAKVIDKRGLSIWDTCKEIAEASIFIGINSGPYWIASCFPHISRKLIITEYSDSTLREYFIPMDARQPHRQWWDWGTQFFNRYPDVDLGVTVGYKKI